MRMPDVRSTIKDSQCNMTYHFLAYRPLTREEMVRGVAMYRSQPKVRRRKTPEKNKVVTIITVHGATPGL